MGLPNPYLSESMMVVVQSGNTLARRWITEQRNIADDFGQAFGQNPPEIIGIGIMTDTDDTGEETVLIIGIQSSIHDLPGQFFFDAIYSKCQDWQNV